MLLIDSAFLFLFLPLVCLAFYLIATVFGRSAGLMLLLAASIYFYGLWGGRDLALLLGSVTVNFVVATYLGGAPERNPNARWAAHMLGQIYNFGTLIWFKYLNVDFLTVPVGISFYTFLQAIFLFDAYDSDPAVESYLGDMRGWRDRLRGYFRYISFATFFPHLILGPIVYLKEFGPQIARDTFGRAKKVNFELGLTLVTIGMFKKIVLADNLAFQVAVPFHAADIGGAISISSAWFGALCYYAQLYFDFSGYSDIAVGVARLMGIQYPMNFYSPLKSVGIVDFYRRWHITLTRAIARFLYTPLSLWGTRFAATHRCSGWASKGCSLWLPLLINFEVIGLWHGAQLTFIAFGLVHGLWYAAEIETRSTAVWKSWKKRTTNRTRTILGRLFFFLPIVLTFALFRSTSLMSYSRLVAHMFGFVRDAHSTLPISSLLFLGSALAIVWLLPNSMELTRNYDPAIATYDNRTYIHQALSFSWRPDLTWSAVMGCAVVAALYFISRQPPFIYMGF